MLCVSGVPRHGAASSECLRSELLLRSHSRRVRLRELLVSVQFCPVVIGARINQQLSWNAEFFRGLRSTLCPFSKRVRPTSPKNVSGGRRQESNGDCDGRRGQSLLRSSAKVVADRQERFWLSNQPCLAIDEHFCQLEIDCEKTGISFSQRCCRLFPDRMMRLVDGLQVDEGEEEERKISRSCELVAAVARECLYSEKEQLRVISCSVSPFRDPL